MTLPGRGKPRRPNSARRLRPGISPGNTELITRSSHHPGRSPVDSLNRIGVASRPPQPVLRCKRQSQLTRYCSPVRPHVLHSLPHGYGEGDMYAIAGGTQTRRRGMRSEQPSKRRASTRAAAWCTVSPYRSMNFTRPTTELKAGLT